MFYTKTNQNFPGAYSVFYACMQTVSIVLLLQASDCEVMGLLWSCFCRISQNYPPQALIFMLLLTIKFHKASEEFCEARMDTVGLKLQAYCLHQEYL